MFGATPLFTNVCFNINKKDRIALVGKNGAGKSNMADIKQDCIPELCQVEVAGSVV